MKGVFWILLIAVACAIALFWFGFSDNSAPLQDRSDSLKPANEDGVPDEPSANSALVAPEPVEATLPQLIVDSFAITEHSSLELWTRITEPTGHVDAFRRKSDGIVVDESLLIDPTDILVAQGWAGNFSLGLQFQDVVLSACGQIVARGQIGSSRPDVAKAVHPNLLPSGWSAQVLAADLPFCPDSQIRGWAVVPGSQAVLAPLEGQFAYVSSPHVLGHS